MSQTVPFPQVAAQADLPVIRLTGYLALGYIAGMDLKTYCSDISSQTELASALKCSQVTVSHWCNKVKPVPVDRCSQIERATRKKVMRWDLRPADWFDHWPELVGVRGAPSIATSKAAA